MNGWLSEPPTSIAGSEAGESVMVGQVRVASSVMPATFVCSVAPIEAKLPPA